jgi:glycine betaine/proline transport system substrate-binding protein
MMMEPTATAMMMPTDSMMMEKAEIIFHNGNWGSNYINNAVAMYILETGYGYPVKEVVTNTNTMKVTLPEGDVHVSMELWRVNLPDWYDEFVVGEGTVVDLAGTTDPSVRLDEGAKGQIISVGGQGTYVPTYVIEGDAERGIEASAPDLSSVADLANYVDVFADPSSPGKGRIFNCPDGWACSKINASNWSAQGLADDFNFVGPGDGTALKAAIASAYLDGDPFIAYYWQPTDIVNTRNLTLLEEPAWTQECQDAINAAVEETPYVSEIGCGYPVGDVHTAVHISLTERAPEAVELLANVFLGDSVLGDLELWKAENDDAEWIDVAIKYLKENRDVWTTWITGDHAADIIAMVDAELAREG